MKPFRLVPEGRGDDVRQHQRALFRLEGFRVGDPTPEASHLPVAALPLREGESYLVQRGKVRPVVVVSTGGTAVPREVSGGSQRWQANRTLLVAPYYGADPGGTRGGWPAQFVTRIRHAEYPQYVWDQLPLGGPAESILRLDHLFPTGSDPAGFRVEPYCLHSDALDVIDSWVEWLVSDVLDEESMLTMIRTELMKLP